MESKYYKLLNCNEFLRKHINDYMESFIGFYGDSYRDEIVEKFSNCTFIGVFHYILIRKFLGDLYQEKTREIFSESIKKFNLDFTYDDLIGNFYSYNEFDSTVISSFHDLYSDYKKGYERRKKDYIEAKFEYFSRKYPSLTKEDFVNSFDNDYIPSSVNYMEDDYKLNTSKFMVDCNYYKKYLKVQSLLRKINPNINSENFDSYLGDDIFSKLDSFYNLLRERREDFIEFKKKFLRFEQYDEFISKHKEMLDNKYLMDFVRDTSYMFLGYDKFFQDISNGKVKPFERGDLFNFVYGSSITKMSSLECFSSDSNDSFNDSSSKLKCDFIKRSRIKYFNLLGFNLGDNYDDYENSLKVRSVWPKQDEVDKFLKLRKDYLNKYNNDLFSINPFNSSIREEINGLGLVIADDAFDASLYNNAAFVNPNLIRKNGSLQLHPVLIVNFNNADSYIDHYITHELNHLIELSFIGETEEEYDFLCGWDDICTPKDDCTFTDSFSQHKNCRKYELFNEVINEKIAQEVTLSMHRDSKYVFNDEDSAAISNGSSYEDMFFLVDSFYETYKSDIIKSRHNGNIHYIYDSVGKDNFDRLNNLCNKFRSQFSSSDFLQLNYEIKNNIDSPNSCKFYELCSERDSILLSMNQYHCSHDGSISHREFK